MAREADTFATARGLRCALSAVGRACVGLFAVCVFTAGARAHAPAEGVGLIWSDESAEAPSTIVTNRGLVFASSADPPALTLRCNEAYSGASTQLPTVAGLAGGLLVGVHSGVFQTADQGCSMSAGSGLPDELLTGVTGSTASSATLLLATRTLQTEAGVYASRDQGESWELRYANPEGEYFDVILAAPSDGSRVYALARRFVDGQSTYSCAVSSDDAESFAYEPLALGVTPFAVHPQDPDVVFAYEPIDDRGLENRILRSGDRCKTFAPVLEGVRQPSALVASGDGKVLWLGIESAGGLYRSADQGESFERAWADRVQSVTCLAERAGVLWLCANLAPNISGVWYIEEGADAIQRFMAFQEVTAPVECADPSAQAVCEGPFRDFAAEHAGVITDAGVSPPVAAAVQDAGVADASGAAAAPVPAEPQGCSLRASSLVRSQWLAWLGLALLWARWRPAEGCRVPW